MDVILRAEAKTAGLKRYFTGVACKRGHVALRSVATGQCTACDSWRAAEKRKADPEKVRAAVRASAKRKRPPPKLPKTQEQRDEARRKYKQSIKDRTNAQQAARRAADPDRHKAYMQKWREKNGAAFLASQRERRRVDPVYAFNGRARCLIANAIRRSGFKKARRTEEILGCTVAELRRQIELQFLPGMSWENMHLWHIDHIVPVSRATSLQEAEALNKAGNLRPMWAKPNRQKGAKVLHLI